MIRPVDWFVKAIVGAAFTVAVNRKYTTAGGEKREETDWFVVNAWGKLGEICNQYLNKGSQACVEGRVKAHGWLAPDGEVRVQLDITASSVQFLGGGQGPGEADGGEVGIDINHLPEDGSESVEASAAAAGHAVVTDDLPV